MINTRDDLVVNQQKEDENVLLTNITIQKFVMIFQKSYQKKEMLKEIYMRS